MRRSSLLLVALLVSACGATATPAPTATVGAPTTAPTPRVTAEPTSPPDTSTPAETPSRAEAYQQLIASIPADVATYCKPILETQKLDPGELAEADCHYPTGGAVDFANYKLFDGSTSMNAFFDTQRKGHESGGTANGPGCGKGPGEGTWDNGRKDCYLFIVNDAQVMWTHDLLYIEANAFRDDGDFAKLEQWWQTAGPVAP